MLTLFHAPRSRSTRFLWLLEELGLPHDIRYVSIRYADGSGDGPDPANPHPDRKVPALRHGDALVTESAAVDADGRVSARTIWPFLVGYLDSVRMLIAWCELRGDFRMFRTDRLIAIDFLDTPYPERRATLRRRWLAMMTARQADG